MKLLLNLFAAFLTNAIALLIAAAWVTGFELEGSTQEIVILAFIFTALNMFLKPVIKLILTPLIIITLGLGLLLVNGIVLKILDFVSETLIIENTAALTYATVLLSLLNIVLHIVIPKGK